MNGLLLGIETSNPTAGPRGEAGASGAAGGAEGAGAAGGREGGGGERGALLGPGVALMAPDGTILGAEALREGSRHDDALMPAIARLFARLGASPRDLVGGRVAVSAGPGGYTALRIAVTTAKMIAEATGCEVVAVPSALVAAYRLPPDLAPALVCLASKKGKAHGTLLTRPGGGAGGSRGEGESTAPGSMVEHARALGLIGAEDLRQLAPRSVIADQHLPEPMRAAASAIGAPVIEPQFAAESVCRLGRDLPPQDPAMLTPIYAREADAVTQWRARRGG